MIEFIAIAVGLFLLCFAPSLLIIAVALCLIIAFPWLLLFIVPIWIYRAINE